MGKKYSNSLVTIMRDILYPLEFAVSSPENFAFFLERYAVELEIEDAAKLIDVLSLKDTFEEVDAIIVLMKEPNPDVELFSKGFKLVKEIYQKVSSVTNLDFSGLATAVSSPAFWGDLFKVIVEDLIAQYIFEKYTSLGVLLKGYGIIEQSEPRASAKFIHKLNLANLPNIFDTKKAFQTYYGWGNSVVEYEKIVYVLQEILSALGIFSYLSKDAGLKEQYFSAQHPLVQDIKFVRTLVLNYVSDDGKNNTLSVDILPIPPSPEDVQKVSGLLIKLKQTGILPNRVSDNFEITYNLFSGDDNLELFIFPNQKIENLSHPNLNPRIDIKSKLLNPTYLIGNESEDGFVLKYSDVQFGISLEKIKKHFNPKIEVEVKDIALKFSQKNSDSFVSSVFKNLETELNFCLKLLWSKEGGLHFQGNSSLEFTLPINKGNEFLKITNLKLGIAPSASKLALKITTGFFAKVGFMQVAVGDVGLKAEIGNSEDGNNNLGFVDIGFGFKRPKVFAINVDSSLISGGGYLDFDPDNHRYAGILALNLKAIEITAIGLITTRLPNNKKGFSMLVSISVLFNPAIQLSFGFTLVGVGGIIGINRTMNVAALRQRVLNGSIDSVMFPKDVIKNADRIISDLREIFPPKSKHFVVAPFLRIGWGTGKLIEVDLGVLLEFPFKGRVILLGSVGVYLPDKKKPISQLNIDVIGDFNFAEDYIQIEGRLRKGSHVAGISLSGGFAFVLSWDKRPQFLFSVGGYHPRYKKPARFPEIPRLAALIQKGKNLVLTCEYYTAITSNSFQIGFGADLYLKKGKVKVHGYFSFNTLIYFDPFYFEADVAMGVLVYYKKKKLAGVELSFLLTGPRPWTVKGCAKFKIAFIKIKIKVKLKWGKGQDAVKSIMESSELLEKLEQQLSAPDNWSAKLPKHFKGTELLRPIEENENIVLLHPSGHLEVRQTVVPLNRRIEKFGSAYVTSKPRYRIAGINLGNGIERGVPLKEYFARGQYEDLTDAQKISSPDFELFDAGYSFGKSNHVAIGGDAMESLDANYEEIVFDDNLETKEEVASIAPLDWAEYRLMENKSERSKHFNEQSEQAYRLSPFQPSFEDSEAYYIVSIVDFADNLGGQVFETYVAAQDYLALHPEIDVNLHEIISVTQYEAEMEKEAAGIF